MGFGAVFDFAVEEEEEEREEEEVDEDKHGDGGGDLRGVDAGGDAVRGAEEFPDDPGLAADFSADPAALLGDVGEDDGGDHEGEEGFAEGVFVKVVEAEEGCEGHEGPEEDHDVVGLECEGDVGPLVAGDLVEASDGGVEVAVGHEAEGAGDFEGVDGFSGGVNPADDGDGCGGGGFIDAFEGGEFGGLVFGDEASAGVAGEELEEEGEEGEGESDGEHGAGDESVAVFEDVVGGDADDEEGAGEPTAEDGVAEAVERGGVEDHVPEVGDFCAGAKGGVDEAETSGGLHPGVGDDDPDGAEVGAEADAAGGEVVEFGADAVPAKEEDAEEAGFEEEGEGSFSGERAAEDVADKARVAGPVGAEGKCLNEAGGNAESEGEGEDVGPEVGHFFVLGVFGF